MYLRVYAIQYVVLQIVSYVEIVIKQVKTLLLPFPERMGLSSDRTEQLSSNQRL